MFRRCLRKSRVLPLSGTSELWYYEAKASFLIIGIDDFFWTSYCLVDAYFGAERLKSTYLKALNGLGCDPATGGSRTMEFPFWNPREMFLATYASRLSGATKEFRNLIYEFDGRMKYYVSAFFVVLAQIWC